MKYKIFLSLFLLITLLSLISALSCNPTSISKSISTGETPSSVSVTCSNSNNYNVNLYKSGDIFSTNPTTPILITNDSSSIFLVNFNQMNSAGSFNSFLYSSDGTTINVNVNVSQNSNPGGIIVFPTSKVINVKQGQTKQQNVQVIVPFNYPSPITIQSVSFNPDISDVIHFSDLDLGLLNPGQTLNIPLVVDANDVQTGIYDTQINILATNLNGQIILQPVSIQIIVTIGVSSSTNANFTKPDCSLSSLEFNLNNSYSFICTNTMNNLIVNVPYNEYLRGINSDYSGGKFTYNFKAVKSGSSTFVATFSYQGSTLFDAFLKDFKISISGSSPVGSVYLSTQFYQNGIKKSISQLNAGDVTIFLVDNSTGNLVTPFEIYLNAQKINSSIITFESGKTYSIRATSPSYNDLVLENISVSKNLLPLTLTPDKSTFKVGEILNITSSVNDTSITLNNVVITSPYTLSTEGNFTIKITKQGYEFTERNITVTNKVYMMTSSPLIEDWKKGKTILVKLNQVTSWSVELREAVTENKITNYKEAVVLKTGNSDLIEFKIEKYGYYDIKSDGELITSPVPIVKTNSWYKFWTWGWYQLILYVGIIIILILLGSGSDEKEED